MACAVGFHLIDEADRPKAALHRDYIAAKIAATRSQDNVIKSCFYINTSDNFLPFPRIDLIHDGGVMLHHACNLCPDRRYALNNLAFMRLLPQIDDNRL